MNRCERRYENVVARAFVGQVLMCGGDFVDGKCTECGWPPPKRPPAHWERLPSRPGIDMPGVELWRYSGFLVTSQLEATNSPRPPGQPTPTWMLAVSRNHRRPTDNDIARALRAFSMQEAIEDNHEPGVKRMFFLPVDPAQRAECECKTDEALVTEPDGYQWSNNLDPLKCRGCEYQRAYGKRCPIHSGAPGVTVRAPL